MVWDRRGEVAGAQARLDIDLGALASNWRLLAKRSGAAECGAAVKADAYGLGIKPVVAALARAGCRTFFVAHVSEAERARDSVGDGAIYLLNGLPPHADAALLRDAGVRPVLCSPEQIATWRAAGGGPCAVQFDTGMNRLGAPPDVASNLTERDLFDLGADLLISHFVASEEPANPFNQTQIDVFSALRARYPSLRASMCNSSGLFLHDAPVLDLTRPGYAMYGGNPTPGSANPMRPVVRLTAPILQLRDVEPGASVGYNSQWAAKRPSRIATIGVGYADGYPRSAGGTDARTGASAIVEGVRCPLAGRVSMDLITLDVTDAPAARVGSAATLIGDGLGVDDLGDWAGTNGYEVLTRLGARYARDYRA